MAKLTMREAVKVFDVSRPTLQKALKSGKVSGAKDGKEQWQFDHSELARVYSPRQSDLETGGKGLPGNFTTENRGLSAQSNAENLTLRAALAEERIRREAAEALAEERGRHIEDLRRMLPAPGSTPTRRWWPW